MSATAIVLTQAKKVLNGPLEELGKLATAAAKDRWKTWKNERNVESLAKKARAITYVKTLWNMDRETSVYAFYYPSKVKFSEAIGKRIDSLAHLGQGQNYVIQGTVGQGKSIFLRYLYGQELRSGTSSGRIPIFVELRRINNTKSLRATLFAAFEQLGFDIDDGLFSWYAESGRIVLLLDAFDEIDQQLVATTLHDLEDISSRYSDLQLIVTSRPDAAIQNSSHFRVLKLAPLAAADHKPFLDRICTNENQANEILQAIGKSTVDVRGLLTTPLLMTLLVLLYKAQAFIPDTVAGFYEQLFDTLFLRHDRSKPGFSRQRFTKLDDDQVKSLFEALCFQARVNGKLVLTMETFKVCLDTAKDATGISVDTWKFRDEIVKTTCLMQEEGHELSFIHKSVVEFHAAAFVRHSSEEVGRTFYDAMTRQSGFGQWNEELQFLRDIDSYRYYRYFFIPLANDTLTRIGVIEDNLPQDYDKLKSDRILQGFYLIGSAADSKVRWYGWGYGVNASFVDQLLVRYFGHELCKLSLPRPTLGHPIPTAMVDDDSEMPGQVDGLRYDVTNLLNDVTYRSPVENALMSGIKKLVGERAVAREIVQRERKKLDVMAKIKIPHPSS